MVALEGLGVSSPLPLKSRLRTLIVDTPVRHFAAAVHARLTQLELLAAQRADFFRVAAPAIDAARLSQVTAIVKTFERPSELARLLESVQRLFPRLKTIVADDSRAPVRHLGAETLILPFDVGVSAGRQAALDRVRTKYTWVLDDDFVLYARTRLDIVLELLDQYEIIDLIGGPVVDIPLMIKRTAERSPIYPTSATPVVPTGTFIGAAQVRDKVPNFFVARTESLRKVGWNSGLKRLDHADFFTRARGVLVTTYLDGFRCLHAPTPFNRSYMAQRTDLDGDSTLLHELYFGARKGSPKIKKATK